MQYDISNEYKISYKSLYFMIGILGCLLPFLDVWKCNWHIPPSISESYYLGAIVPFVLILGSMGIIFFCNTGFNNLDKWCNRISGIAALGVISFPCDSKNKLFNLIQYPVIHYISAVILFSTFAFMCAFVFTNVRNENGYTRNKQWRNLIYRLCSISILTGMLISWKINIFWGEVMMIYSFVTAYLIQGGVAFKDKH